MKSLFFIVMIISACSFHSCNENAGSDKKNGDSAVTGLEGTRNEASQLSNAPVDTSGGQSGNKTAKDSTHVKDSLNIK